MNILSIFLLLILFCSCGTTSFDGRFERMVETDVLMHFGPEPPHDNPESEENSAIKVLPKVIMEDENDSSPGWWGEV